jgi:hypothetical protein
MLERMIGAAKLDVKVINEIEADRNAMSQAILVVIISAISAGIGALAVGWVWLIISIIVALIGWAIFAALVFWIGTKYFKEETTHADWGQVARVLGFAQSPGVFRFLGIIPFIGGLISLAITIWIIVASVIAIREALDYKATSTAVIVAILAFIPLLVFNIVISVLAFS